MAAVVAVGVAAVVDSLRGDEEGASPAPDVLREAYAELVRTLRENGVLGTLIYVDGNCVVRGRRLPDLAPVPSPAGRGLDCRISVSPDGKRVTAAGAAWPDGLSGSYAICRAGRVGVYIPPSGTPQYDYAGCAPAWRGLDPEPWAKVLTVVRKGRVVEVRPTCEGQPPCARVLIGGTELERAARLHPDDPDLPGAVAGIEALDAEWLSRERAALLLRIRFRGGRPPAQQHVAFFERGRLTAIHAIFGEEIERLEAAPGGGYVAGEPRLVLRRDGSELALPLAVAARDLAWSPDGSWLAATGRESVVLYRVADLERSDTTTGVRIPLTVRDLAWR